MTEPTRRNAEDAELDYEVWRKSPEAQRAGHYIASDGRSAWSVGDVERAAFVAGAASRQGEVDRLRKVLEMLEIDLVDPITGNCDICKQSNIYGRHWECGFAELEKTGG